MSIYNCSDSVFAACKIRVYLRQQLLGIIFSEVGGISCRDPRRLPRQLRQIKVNYSYRENFSEASPITDLRAFHHFVEFALKGLKLTDFVKRSFKRI